MVFSTVMIQLLEQDPIKLGNGLLVIIIMIFMKQAETIIRNIFGFGNAKSLGDAVAAGALVAGSIKAAGSTLGALGKAKDLANGAKGGSSGNSKGSERKPALRDTSNVGGTTGGSNNTNGSGSSAGSSGSSGSGGSGTSSGASSRGGNNSSSTSQNSGGGSAGNTSSSDNSSSSSSGDNSTATAQASGDFSADEVNLWNAVADEVERGNSNFSVGGVEFAQVGDNHWTWNERYRCL